LKVERKQPDFTSSIKGEVLTALAIGNLSLAGKKFMGALGHRYYRSLGALGRNPAGMSKVQRFWGHFQ